MRQKAFFTVLSSFMFTICLLFFLVILSEFKSTPVIMASKAVSPQPINDTAQTEVINEEPIEDKPTAPVFQFMCPVEGGFISSPFGLRENAPHTGLDIAVGTGTMVYAAESGTVTASKWIEGYGKTVILTHIDGFSTLYGHLSECLVEEGDLVEKGKAIAVSGNTGKSTGPHLHFEIRKNDEFLDPYPYIY